VNSLPGLPYLRRIVDDELDELQPALAAIALEGAKAVGKTRTAEARAQTIHRLADPIEREVVAADPARLIAEQPRPILIDEWQRLPESWDLVRQAVDDGAAPGSFLLTGSSHPRAGATHSGAGRIVSIRMRPLALSERGIAQPTVSLAALLSGSKPEISGETDVNLENYVDEILGSGFPAIRALPSRAKRAQLDGYLERVVDHDFEEIGQTIRNPVALRRWMTAYAAATSTTTSYAKIRDAASGGRNERDIPAKETGMAYRDALERLWIIEPLDAWLPTRNQIVSLSSPPKHQLVDPALAASLLGVDASTLLEGQSAGPPIPRKGSLLGDLFESLATLNVRAYAQHSEARVKHLRLRRGEHEIDLIVERADGRVVAIEIKLKRTPDDGDAEHLNWLAGRIDDDLLDRVILTTGPSAYRRRDGVAVVPAALLGP
jgi:predicted AAA+ superfamily ATPase